MLLLSQVCAFTAQTVRKQNGRMPLPRCRRLSCNVGMVALNDCPLKLLREKNKICNIFCAEKQFSGSQFIFRKVHCIYKKESRLRDSSPAAGRVSDIFHSAAVRSTGGFYTIGNEISYCIRNEPSVSGRFRRASFQDDGRLTLEFGRNGILSVCRSLSGF